MEFKVEQFYDDAFCVEKTKWGTYRSKDKEGNYLITSLHEEICIHATRFYLKGLQEGFTETKVHSGIVDGKL